jgi:hypothetical protein
MRIDLFNQPPAVVAREEALTKVAGNSPEWMQKAIGILREYPNEQATGEDLREFVRSKIGDPHHHNVYGAMIMSAVRKGMLVNTGVYQNMKLKQSHARRNPVYQIVR